MVSFTKIGLNDQCGELNLADSQNLIIFSLILLKGETNREIINYHSAQQSCESCCVSCELSCVPSQKNYADPHENGIVFVNEVIQSIRNSDFIFS